MSAALRDRLRPRRGSAEPRLDGDRVVLDGRFDWVLDGAAEELERVAQALPGSERIGNVLLLRFGNSVGRLELPLLGTIEVVSGKWRDVDLERMLAELMDVACALPFAVTEPLGLPHERRRADRDEVLYHAFAYLRHALADDTSRSERLDTALAVIVRTPHELLARERRRVSADRGIRLDARSLQAIAMGASVGSDGELDLPALAGLVLDEPATRRSVDTPENRFVKAFLARCMAVVDRVRHLASERAEAVGRRLAASAEAIDRRLAPFARHPLWRTIGTMVHVPTSSTILQGRRGYRQVLGHHARLQLAAQVPLEPTQMRDLLELRNIADLYELWCFYRVVAVLQELLGPPATADRPRAEALGLVVPWDLEVRWASGIACRYNARFAAGAARSSYSLPLRPDIVVEIATGSAAGLHLFDAKFRVELIRDLGDDVDDVDVRGPVRDTLYKMHTYRDAIVDARTVRVLYPGNEEVFYPQRNGCNFDGIGAVPLTPTLGVAALRTVLEALVG